MSKETIDLKDLDDLLCKYEVKDLEDLENRFKNVADLEVKLAESEKKHLLDEKEWQDYCAYKTIEPQIKGCLDREKELKQQLAEKDEEIARLKLLVDSFDKLKQYDKDAKQIILINPDNVYADGHTLVVKSADQDKISFAVEQLEKVKETVECVLDNALKNSSLNQSYYDRLLDEIDNQIKQLKEMK